MALRISRMDDETGSLIKIDGSGSLSARELSTLRSCMTEVPSVNLKIDLSGTRFLDEAALQIIRDSVVRGARVEGESAYLSMRLGLTDTINRE